MTISNTTRFELYTWSSGEDEFSRQQMTESHISLGDNAALFLDGTSATPPTSADSNSKAFYWDSTNSKLYFRGTSTSSWQQIYPILPAGHVHSDLQPITAELTALISVATTGVTVRTGTATYATRSLAVSGSGLSVTNADGVSGNMTITIASASTNTPSTVVYRDTNGDFSAGTITASLVGNASTATTLATSRSISISGDATAPSVSFNGSAAVPLSLTLATVNSNTGAFGDSVTIPAITVNGKGLVTAVTGTAIRSASTSTTGITQLTDSTSSTSTTTAATPNSVKSAYDLANAALARSGGTMSGKITTVASGTSTASILLSAGSADPSSPASGDVWNNAGTLKIYNGTATKTIAYTDGNVSTASALQTARTFTFTGDVATSNSGSTAVTASFDGSSAPSFTLRVKNDSHTHDTQYYTETELNNAKLYQYGNITSGGTDTSGSALLSGSTRQTPRIYVQSNDPSAATGYVGVTGDIWFQI